MPQMPQIIEHIASHLIFQLCTWFAYQPEYFLLDCPEQYIALERYFFFMETCVFVLLCYNL